jgi:hypothetical protein
VTAHRHASNTLRLSTDFCVKIVRLQSVGAGAIRKTPSLEDVRLETDIRSAASGEEAVGCHQVS